MIKSIGSFVKKKMADVSNASLPPPRPPPPRPPPPKEYANTPAPPPPPKAAAVVQEAPKEEVTVVQEREASFETESDLTEALNVSGEVVNEKSLDETIDYIDEDNYDTAEEFLRISSADGTSKDLSPEKEGGLAAKSVVKEAHIVSQAVTVEVMSQEFVSTGQVRSVQISQTGGSSQQGESVEVCEVTETSQEKPSAEIQGQVECIEVLPVAGTSQQEESSETSQETVISQQVAYVDVSDGDSIKEPQVSEGAVDDVDAPPRELSSIDKKDSAHASRESIMAELDSAWVSVETSALEELRPSSRKACRDIAFTADKAKGVKVSEMVSMFEQGSEAQQTVYVAQVSQVSKVFVSEDSSAQVPQQAVLSREVVPPPSDGYASEDPDYAENTDVAEDADYTEDETEDELFRRESDFWEIDFDKYMDALLADLQNTITPGGTAPGTPYPAHNGASTPSPGPSPGPSPNATLIHNHIHNRNGHDQMYHQERVEEVRTEQRSSGGGTKMSFNNNLSELDTLLQDLNNARYTGVFKEPAATTNGTINGSRPSVDSLLDELNSVDTSREIVESHTVTHEVKTTKLPIASSTSPQPMPAPLQAPQPQLQQPQPQQQPPPPSARAPHPSASSATKELDDLMASLSDFKKGDLTDLESQIVQEKPVLEQVIATTATASSSASSTMEVKKTKKVFKFKRSSESTDSDYGSLTRGAPPRPPPPEDADLLAIPPPRPPVPTAYSASPIPPEAYIFGSPVLIPVPAGNPLEDPFHRPPSGGPVKRNDAEYRWVTDATKYEVREVIDFPCVSEKKQEKLRSPALVRKLINASSLQTQVDSAYAKPQKPKSPSPPTPTPTPPTPTPTPPKEPTPPPVNQLDCMLGSLATHMTEQGITTTQKGCCCACDKPIVGQVITALGKTWHPEHFTCTHCNQELGTRNFFERDGKPYCEVDYHNLFSPRCAYCDGPILDKCVTALDKTWHPDHFFCAQCGNTFGEDGFHEKDGKPYCRNDYFNMFAPKCGGCNAPIMDNYISALNAQWHPECFVCRDCRQPFNGGSFFDHEGLPYCETHYHAKRGSLCAGCHKPITGRCITAMFRKFHPEHFVCSFCLKQLNKGTFKEQNDKPYCHGCFDKLFG
ncbi:protein SON-like isoform X3 [Macrobrachium nipponense]|uniref:protein SON-like isoform X3 n=1 Tax=Macrobrachium nipponense TaxID=159736 RepID=UPI0030C876C5